eukprot:GILJ01002123.1.p1 GENE.GILJ01002123.1~~GILJ01002123.1.p1  ORF type:complete len:270 (+),score=38.12 GILJ01002123.1:72-812(+)
MASFQQQGRLCGTAVTLNIILDGANVFSVTFSLWNHEYVFNVSTCRADLSTLMGLFFLQERDPSYGRFENGVYDGDATSAATMIRQCVVDIFQQLNSLGYEQEHLLEYAIRFLRDHATPANYQDHVATLACRWIVDNPKFAEAVRERRRRRQLLYTAGGAIVGFVAAPMLITAGLGALGFSAIGPVAGTIAARVMPFLGGTAVYGAAQSAAMAGIGAAAQWGSAGVGAVFGRFMGSRRTDASNSKL